MGVLVTGGAGFIGSNFVLDWLGTGGDAVVTLDKLTYAGNLANLASLEGRNDHRFVHGGIEDEDLVADLLRANKVRAIVHFAAESHVDRSILGPQAVVETNVLGTQRLLQTARLYWEELAEPERSAFRFLHVSTDEVYGSLEPEDPAFRETNPFRPNSPYAASKAAADHLVRAYGETYGLPVLTSNCSNNYGPFHFPEKLIPLCIHHALEGKALPIYGDGQQIRDWLYVGDHCSALRTILAAGRPRETYNVGGGSEKTNLEVIDTICKLLDEARPRATGGSYADQITFVTDRRGHDRRYAVDSSKLQAELGWAPSETFESGIRKTVAWYLEHPQWLADVTSGAYRSWIERQYQ